MTQEEARDTLAFLAMLEATITSAMQQAAIAAEQFHGRPSMHAFDRIATRLHAVLEGEEFGAARAHAQRDLRVYGAVAQKLRASGGECVL